MKVSLRGSVDLDKEERLAIVAYAGSIMAFHKRYTFRQIVQRVIAVDGAAFQEKMAAWLLKMEEINPEPPVKKRSRRKAAPRQEPTDNVDKK